MNVEYRMFYFIFKTHFQIFHEMTSTKNTFKPDIFYKQLIFSCNYVIVFRYSFALMAEW